MDEKRDPHTKEVPGIKMTKLFMIKNVSMLCVGVFLLFIAYDGLTMLQSTMNREHGIGVASQAIVYSGFCISAVLFPKYVLMKLGSKRTLVLSMLTYVPYIASNFYPHWVLMIPSSILIGLGASLLWGSQAKYLNDIAVMYASLTVDSKKKSTISFIGSETKHKYYYESHQKSRPISALNLFTPKSQKKEMQYGTVRSDSSFCFSPGRGALGVDNTYFSASNRDPDSLSDVKIHGDLLVKSQESDLKMNYGTCNDTAHTTINPDSKDSRKITNGRDDEIQPLSKIIESTTARFFGFHGMAYLSTHLFSNLITYYVLKTDVDVAFTNSSCVCGAHFCNVETECFVNNLQAPSDSIRYILTGSCTILAIFSIIIVALLLDPLETLKPKVSFTLELMMATYKFAKRKELLLLIPSSFYIGMFQGFYTGDFTKSYIACAWGIYHVGLVSACYGSACGAMSIISGWLVKKLGRIPIFTSAFVVNVTAIIFLLLWIPDQEHTPMFFYAAALWGAHVGILWSQLRALYGMLFKADEDAAFAAFHVWYSLGFCLSFGYSNFFCTYVKIYMLLIVSTFGFVGYLLVERIQKIKIKP